MLLARCPTAKALAYALVILALGIALAPQAGATGDAWIEGNVEWGLSVGSPESEWKRLREEFELVKNAYGGASDNKVVDLPPQKVDLRNGSAGQGHARWRENPEGSLMLSQWVVEGRKLVWASKTIVKADPGRRGTEHTVREVFRGDLGRFIDPFGNTGPAAILRSLGDADLISKTQDGTVTSIALVKKRATERSAVSARLIVRQSVPKPDESRERHKLVFRPTRATHLERVR